MHRTGIRLAAAGLVSAGVLGFAAGSAFAAGAPSANTQNQIPNTLSNIQARAAAAITLRVNDLTAAIAKVNAAKNLGSGAATLDDYLGVDVSPLQALGQKIASDTSVVTATVDYEDIFTDYRVLALVLPAARLAATSDSIDNGALPKLTADSAKAATYENPTTQATLNPLISQLNSEISAASTSTVGVASTVLGYVPSQWNSNHSLLTPARSSVSSAVGDVKQGRSDIQQVRAYLRASHPAVTPATTSTTPA